MLKHIYSIPSIKVMSVDTEDILTNFSNAQEVTGGNLGENIGGGGLRTILPLSLQLKTKRRMVPKASLSILNNRNKQTLIHRRAAEQFYG